MNATVATLSAHSAFGGACFKAALEVSSPPLEANGELMRGLVIVLALMLVGCVTQEDAGVRAAKMEAQDDASCRQLSTGKGADAYTQCRKNLLYYRQQAVVEEQQAQAKRERVSDALMAASRSLQSINPPPQEVNVNVTCTFGCR
ncbi:hypothetical protein ABIB73_006646 [Bradyrhizobium sp. F1.4.3]|uniref:hypothetical protein n=1 Tax=Bradyrhizobium sp. F1.4.3 TaxID=3156356 RepID=UPI0033940539